MARPYFPVSKVTEFGDTLKASFGVTQPAKDVRKERESTGAIEYFIGPIRGDPRAKGKLDIWGDYGSHVHIVFTKDPKSAEPNLGYRINNVIITLRPKGMRALDRDNTELKDVSTNLIHHHYSYKVDLNTEVDGDANRETLISYIKLSADQWLERFKDSSKLEIVVTPDMINAWTPLGSYAKGPVGQEARMNVANVLHDVLAGVRNTLNILYGADWALEWDK